MLSALLVVFIIMSIGLIACIISAPRGYEDEKGFHLDK